MVSFRKILAVVLVFLGVYMIYLGEKAGILPPTVTGIGFILIAVIFLLQKRG